MSPMAPMIERLDSVSSVHQMMAPATPMMGPATPVSILLSFISKQLKYFLITVSLRQQESWKLL